MNKNETSNNGCLIMILGVVAAYFAFLAIRYFSNGLIFRGILHGVITLLLMFFC